MDLLEIRWPSGQVDTIKDVAANQVVYLKEAQGIAKLEKIAAKPSK